MRFIMAAIVFSGLWANPAYAKESHHEFFVNLKAICGHSYLGKIVESNESDATWRNSKVVIHAPACDAVEGHQIRLPLHVGENTSRTLIITRTPSGLSLQHDHRHEDGSEDDVSMYGGHTLSGGTANKQDFPADDFSKALFVEHGLDVSVNNTWTISVEPGKILTYRLSRPGRLFQINFDLESPID